MARRLRFCCPKVVKSPMAIGLKEINLKVFSMYPALEIAAPEGKEKDHHGSGDEN